MAFDLRPYQKRSAAEVLNRASLSVRPVVVSPGGSGKTVIIAEVACAYMREGKRVMVVSHRKEIIVQIREHIRGFDVPDSLVGVISAQMGAADENYRAPIQIVSKDTVVRRKLLPAVDVVIVDECHHVVAAGYKRLLERFPGALHIGFTATPLRYDGRGLREWYNDLIIAAIPSELVEQGWLAVPRVFTTADNYLPNLSHVPVRYGEYSPRHLEHEMRRKELSGNIVQTYIKHGLGKPFVGFSVTINHSKQLVDEFLAAGIPAAHIDGNTTSEDRDQLLQDLRGGKIMGVFNCMLLCEGWDFPGCEVVIFARPTRSLALFLQQASRGMRPLGDKRPIILDHARNTNVFGMPHANRYYTLDGTEPKIIQAGPVKACRNCHALVDRAAEVCPECGEEFGRDIVSPTESSEALEELTKAKIQEFRDKLVQKAKARGWSDNWVEAVLERWLTMKGAA